MTHDLKCWPMFYQMIEDKMKRFEIRERRDRSFTVGDVLRLREWNPQTEAYTGRECHQLVTYLTDFEQKPGFVVMSLAEL